MTQYIKHSRFFLLFIGSFFMISLGNAQPANKNTATNNKPLHLFVIGNSFSKNATMYLPQLAKEGGHPLVIERAQISGGSLKMHWDAVELFEADSSNIKGRPYYGRKSLKTMLSEGTWDVVTLQQASTFSGYVESYEPYLKNLIDYIKKFQPNAEIVIHQTWPYRNDARYFTRISDSERAKNQEEMWKESRAAYRKVAKQYGARVIPTGDGFWNIASDPQWAYIKDTEFDYKTPVYPAVPNQKNSLNTGYHWTKNKTFKLDPNHANAAGCYLGGLIWYTFLFNESPENLKFVPKEVPEDFAAHLRVVAKEVVKEGAKEDKVKVRKK